MMFSGCLSGKNKDWGKYHKLWMHTSLHSLTWLSNGNACKSRSFEYDKYSNTLLRKGRKSAIFEIKSDEKGKAWEIVNMDKSKKRNEKKKSALTFFGELLSSSSDSESLIIAFLKRENRKKRIGFFLKDYSSFKQTVHLCNSKDKRLLPDPFHQIIRSIVSVFVCILPV